VYDRHTLNETQSEAWAIRVHPRRVGRASSRQRVGAYELGKRCCYRCSGRLGDNSKHWVQCGTTHAASRLSGKGASDS